MTEIIASFWRGNLTSYEILSINSWLVAGYEFHLYSYEPITNLPSSVICCDAREILPESYIDKFKFIANFADCFRYKMIYDTGKIWTDLDCFCLNRLDLSASRIFVSERTIKHGAFKSKLPYKIVVSFLKGEQGDELFNTLYKQCLILNEKFNAKITKNIGLQADKHPGGRKLLTKLLGNDTRHIKPYNFAFPIDWWDYDNCFNNVLAWGCSRGWTDIISVDKILNNGELLIIHNGWLKHHKIDRDNPEPGSLYDKLIKKISSATSK